MSDGLERRAERIVYAGPGWVGGRWRQVESRRGAGGYVLRIAGAGEFTVDDAGSAVVRRTPVDGMQRREEIAAAVLGPCLILALALRGVWCLHASAAGPEGSASALAGESGSGKSTLAAALASAGGSWRRVADDLLPVAEGSDRVMARPRFPQPNLAPLEQWRRPAPAQVELTAIWLLEPGGDRVETSSPTRRQATQALVRQTMAGRLFDGALQARHLDFCAGLSQRLPVRVLRFPRRHEALPAMMAAIRSDR